MEIIIDIIYSLFWGWGCSELATSKGRNATVWFWVGFLIGIFGLMILASLPELENSQKPIEASNPNKKSISEKTNYSSVNPSRLDIEILKVCNSGKNVTISDIIISTGGYHAEVRDKVEEMVVKGLLKETIENGKHYYEAM